MPLSLVSWKFKNGNNKLGQKGRNVAQSQYQYSQGLKRGNNGTVYKINSDLV